MSNPTTDYGLRLATGSDSITISGFVGSWTGIETNAQAAEVTISGSGDYTLTGATARFLRSIEFTDSNGLHFIDLNRDSGTPLDITDGFNALTATVTNGSWDLIFTTVTVTVGAGKDYPSCNAAVAAEKNAGLSVLVEIVVYGIDTVEIENTFSTGTTRCLFRGATPWTDKSAKPIHGVVTASNSFRLCGTEAEVGYPQYMRDLLIESGGSAIGNVPYNYAVNYDLEDCYVQSAADMFSYYRNTGVHATTVVNRCILVGSNTIFAASVTYQDVKIRNSLVQFALNSAQYSSFISSELADGKVIVEDCVVERPAGGSPGNNREMLRFSVPPTGHVKNVVTNMDAGKVYKYTVPTVNFVSSGIYAGVSFVGAYVNV